MGASTEGALIGFALGAAYMMLPKLVEGASEAANSVVSAAKDKAGELFSAAIEGTRKGLTTAATWISESASSVAKTAREGATYVVESVKSGLSTVADVASKYADDVSARAVNLYDSIKSSAVALVKTATAVPAGLILRSREAVYSLWEGTKQTVRSWLWGILNVFNNSGPLDGSSGSGSGSGGANGGGSGNASGGGSRIDSGGGTGAAGRATSFQEGPNASGWDAPKSSVSYQSSLAATSGPGAWRGTANSNVNGSAPSFAPTDQVDRARERMAYLMQKGYDAKTAGAIVGNAWHESAGLNPKIKGDNGNSMGEFQFNNKGEQPALRKFAAARGLDVNDWRTQYDFVHEQLQGPYRKTLNRMQSAQSIDEATVAFSRGYERPLESAAYNDRRIKWAKVSAGLVNTAPPPPDSKTAPGGPASSIVSGSGVVAPDAIGARRKASFGDGIVSDSQAKRRLPAMYSGSGVQAPDSIGAGKKGDFGTGISDGEKDVSPAKRFETRPDTPTKEGGGDTSQRDDSGEQQDTAMDKKRRRAIMMNNDAGTYMISHQDAMA